MELRSVPSPTREATRGQPHIAYCVYKDKQGYWRWYLMHSNVRIADCNNRYSTRSECLADIKVVRAATDAPIFEPQP